MADAIKLGWFKSTLAKMGYHKEHLSEVDQAINQYGSETLTSASLLGSGSIGARSRQMIYSKYQQMVQDPVVASALRLHVTAALGGHETSGDLVFIEGVADKQDAQTQKIVKEIAQDLGPLFNRIAMTVAYNAVSFGDAYGRIYPVKNKGVVDIYVDEMVLPPLVQPYEQGNKTVVCVLAIGPKMRERLIGDQIVRMRLSRMIYTPQPMAVEKSWRTQIVTNDPEELPIMPALVGGSFLAEAEVQYDNFKAALAGLVGQRVLDSIDESMITANVAGMTKEQRQEFLKSFTNMLKKSKELADEAIKNGTPVLSRIRHMIPVWNEKQVMGMQGLNSGGGSGGGRAGNITVDDVMFHAKLLSGALGVDITMLGFADLMSGGLGDGGFFRTSAQAAERSRTIRVALSDFFNDIIDVHVLYKYGNAFDRNKRPWKINFYGSISALETERQKTQTDAMGAGQLLIQTLTMARDLGMDEKSMAHLLEKVMKMDAEDAKMYAKAVKNAKPPEQAGFGGGGFGDDPGGGIGGLPFAEEGDENQPPRPKPQLAPPAKD
jgi:hypothetical protein